jgi:Haem-degrading
MHLKPSIDFPLANALLTSALSRSQELGARVSIAIADHAGELIAFARMDGARSFTIDLAMEPADRRQRRARQPSLALAPAGRPVEFPMNDSRLGDELGALRWDVERHLNDELARVG